MWRSGFVPLVTSCSKDRVIAGVTTAIHLWPHYVYMCSRCIEEFQFWCNEQMGGRERVLCVRLTTGPDDGVWNQLEARLCRPIHIGPDVKCIPGIFPGGAWRSSPISLPAPRSRMGKVNGRKQWMERLLKIFFPSVERRLAVDLNLSPKITTIMTGHGNIRSYLLRLKIIGSPQCPFRHGIQTVDHLIFQCNRLKKERKIKFWRTVYLKKVAGQRVKVN